MFYYRAGNISTTAKWKSPTKKAFNLWLSEWQKSLDLTNYNVYLTGGFCEKYFSNKNIKTNDIDLFITPINKDNIKYTQLKYILEQAIHIGFRYKLLIDIWYNAKAPYDFSKDKEVIGTPSNSIICYRETEKKTNKINSKHVIENTIELIPGLYEVVYNIEEVRKKFNSKNYLIPYHKIDILS